MAWRVLGHNPSYLFQILLLVGDDWIQALQCVSEEYA